MSKRFMVVGTSNDVPDNQIRMCGIFEQEFENGEVVYATREPITCAPIKLTVNTAKLSINNDIICIADEPLKMYGCIISPHTWSTLGLDIGLDMISIVSEKELSDFREEIKMENNTEYRVSPTFLQIGKPYYIEDKDGDGQWVIVKKIINSDFQDKVICVTAGTNLVFSCKDILDGKIKIIRDDYMVYDEHDKHHFVRIINKEENKNGKED